MVQTHCVSPIPFNPYSSFIGDEIFELPASAVCISRLGLCRHICTQMPLLRIAKTPPRRAGVILCPRVMLLKTFRICDSIGSPGFRATALFRPESNGDRWQNGNDDRKTHL